MLPAWLDRSQRGALLFLAVLYSAGYGTWGLFILLITAVLEAVVTRRVPWPRSRFDPFVAAFLLILLFSGYVFPYRPIAIASTGLAALTIYLAFGVSSAVLRRHEEFLRPLIAAWVSGGVVAALWGLFLYRRTGPPVFLPELGRNALGTTLLIASVLCLGQVLESRAVWRYLAAAACLVLLAGLVATYSRGAWLGATAGMLLLMVLSGVQRTLKGTALLMLLLLAGIGLAGSGRAVFQRASTISDLAANQDRVIMFQTSLRIVAAHPLVGTGLNTFAVVYAQYRSPDDPNPMPLPFAHNIFVNMAVEGGVLGLAAFVGILTQGVVAGWMWCRSARYQSETIMAAATLSALVGAMVHQLFDGTLISVHLGLGMWLLLGMLNTRARQSMEIGSAPGWTSA